MNIILFYFFFCLVSNLVNGTTVAEGLNLAGLVLLSGSKGCFHKCFCRSFFFLASLPPIEVLESIPRNDVPIPKGL